MPNHRLATKTQGKGTHMRKNNRTYSPSLNTLLVSVAVATIPGMGYAAYTTTDCNNFKNIYPTAFSNLRCSGWNGKCSWDAFRAELISVCNTKGQNIDCEESAESGVLGDILATNCHSKKDMTTAELCATNYGDDQLKACFATSGGGDDDNPGGTGGTNTPPNNIRIILKQLLCTS